MIARLVILALSGLSLAGCSGFEEGIPVYVGDRRVSTLNALGGAPAPAQAVDECQALALRAADPQITDAQRRAAAEYRASLGC